jgi:hypothetical protein
MIVHECDTALIRHKKKRITYTSNGETIHWHLIITGSLTSNSVI